MQVIEAQHAWSWRLTITSISSMSGWGSRVAPSMVQHYVSRTLGFGVDGKTVTPPALCCARLGWEPAGMDERVTFPVTTEEKQRLADFAKRLDWSPTAAARFLCLAGLDPMPCSST